LDRDDKEEEEEEAAFDILKRVVDVDIAELEFVENLA
jgi:hypothetical protein